MADDSRRTPNLSQTTPNKNLTFAITSVFAAPVGVAVAQDDSSSSAGALEEIIVTARKRTESLMDVPESIQAISGQQITQAGLQSMDDYVRFIPSMSYVQSNPGTAKIIFRGIADDAATFIAEPSAALYLDEQSLALNATPDPRMVDIERVEALSGPQGTLYGASSQSGTLRIITNKPDPTAFDSFVDVMLKTGSDSDMSYDVSAMGNFPITEDFAIRLVGFTAEDGGFIDVVEGTTPRFELFSNEDVTRSNFNDVETKGGRISARWFMSDDWTMTAGVIYQDTRSNGRPEQDSTLGRDYAVVRFRPDQEYDDQDWTQYALTFEGDLGFADFVSATSYFTRDWTYAQDTSVGYASYFGTFCYSGYYYDFSQYSKYCFQPAGVGNYYNDPIGYLENIQENTKFSQEFRLSASGDRLDWIAGLFYEKQTEDWDFYTYETGYGYRNSKSFENLLAGNGWNQPNIPPFPTDIWWYSYDRTEWEQYAAFGEITWHITDRWDATLGGRWFNRTMDKVYGVENPFGNPAPVNPSDPIEDHIFVTTPTSDESDFVPKFSLSYRINDDWLVYGLYSEGFRPGGTNRGRGQPFLPRQYDSDILENIEFGVKATLADGRVRMTATYFDMSWNDYQLEVVDPSNTPCGTETAPPEPFCGQPWQKVVANVGNASSQGVEFQIDAAAGENWTMGLNFTYLDAKVDDEVNVSIPVPAGSPLPLSPEWKGSAYAQYDWPVSWFGGRANNAFARLQWSYTDEMLNIFEPLTLDDGPSPQIVQPSYNIGDLRVGTGGDDWTVHLFVNNLTDERAILFANPFEFDYFFGRARETVNRPREYGIRFIKNFR